jgi:thiamine kinase-like enzyme
MKYMIMAALLLMMVGCRGKSTSQLEHERSKYPECLKYEPKPSKPFAERLKHPYWNRRCTVFWYTIARMQSFNIEYGQGYGLKYLEYLKNRDLIGDDLYAEVRRDYIHYMPRKR